MDFEREELSNNDTKNFKYLDDLIHSGVKEIVLDLDIALDDDEQSEYEDGIKLDVDDIVIDGNGHTIDPDVQGRIFSCTGKNIKIKNITLEYGSNIDGGAINNNGELTIIKSLIRANESGDCGGAISNSGELTIIESLLNKNTACQSGGAISNFGKLTITESIFNENKVSFRGGAIVNYNAECTISNSTFDGYTGRLDEAIENYEAECTISNSTFDGDTIKKRKEYKNGWIDDEEDDYIGTNCFSEHSHDDFNEEYEAIQKEMERLRLNK